MRPICAKCRREMFPAKNEFLVKDKATERFPSTYHFGDLYECPECGCQIVSGFGKPLPPDFTSAEALEFTR